MLTIVAPSVRNSLSLLWVFLIGATKAVKLN